MQVFFRIYYNQFIMQKIIVSYYYRLIFHTLKNQTEANLKYQFETIPNLKSITKMYLFHLDWNIYFKLW